MATSTPSPTPSEDNRQNNRDDTMYSALDKIMGNSVQSYDDFLNSFTYLKKGLQEKQDGKKDKPKRAANKMNKTTSTSASVKLPKPEDGSKAVYKESKPEVSSSSSCDIEEEILCEGDITSRMTKTKVIKTGSLVKFDNFVDPVANDDDDDIEEIDDLSAVSYTASFTTGKSTSNTAASEKQNEVAVTAASSRLQDDSDATNMLETQLSLDEKSTDKLLMNFLADLQNELNEGKPVDTSQSGASNSEMDIQNFLHKNKKPSQQVSDSEEVNFNDDDENDAVSLLHDDSEKNDVKVKISEQDLKTMAGPNVRAEQDRISRLDDIYRNTLRDSEGNVQIAQSEESVVEQKAVDGDIDIDKIVFPGQVEERNDEPGSENDRLLDFKATFRETSTSTDTQVESTDLIQPFKLDEDFDYDNVVLAPKFSSEDLQQFKLNVKPQTVVM
ncbi:uncharacterized protein LOC123536191 [Mercenaria mercenaria]|uniref:uncharacterized protein LOC123536191 n=1 Tax=Mercenaria mercenaria TaxID=6596 RepID=UPI00234EBC33|nr:uncharacterized protein LOC123536191 [Mercenaria mercenaria]